MNLEEFLEGSLEEFEARAKKFKKLTPELLAIAKSMAANRLTYLALLQFPNKEEEIRNYLKRRGYDSEKGKKIEETERSIRISELEQNPRYN